MLLFFMLNRRTNILLNEADYMALNELASNTKKTMGELIREAIAGFYGFKKKEEKIDDLLNRVHKLAKKINTKGIDYREMIDYGRKY